MLRRTLLQSIGTGASLIPFTRKQSIADTLPSASHFDGNTNLSGKPQGFPVSSPYGAIGILHNSYNMNQQYFLTSQIALGQNSQFIITSNIPGSVGAYFYQPGNPYGTPFYNLVSTSSTGWLTTVIVWDMTIPKLDMWMTGAPNISTTSYAPAFTVNYGTAPIFGISGFVDNGQLYSPFIGDIGYFYLQAGTKCDINDIIEAFYDFESGFARRIGGNGLGVISNVKPQIFLYGNPQVFPTNLTTGGNGMISAKRGDTSSQFTVIGSPLGFATSDPFEPGT